MNRFLFHMQVFSEDTDSFGIVHHANYIKFMERARLVWLLKLGVRLDDLLARGIFFVIKQIEIEYVKPARLYDELEIESCIVTKRRVAKTYKQTIRCQKDPALIYCIAKVHVVCVDNKMRPQSMPLEIMEKI